MASICLGTSGPLSFRFLLTSLVLLCVNKQAQVCGPLRWGNASAWKGTFSVPGNASGKVPGAGSWASSDGLARMDRSGDSSHCSRRNVFWKNDGSFGNSTADSKRDLHKGERYRLSKRITDWGMSVWRASPL